MDSRPSTSKSARTRSENWTEEDKNLLKELVRDRVHVIENKNTDTNTNVLKKNAWLEVLQSFNSLCKGGPRLLPQLKSQWGTIKLIKKKEIAILKREVNKTGGGPPPAPHTNSEDDITAWLPNEFIVDSNKYDSDNVPAPSCDKIIEDNCPFEVTLEPEGPVEVDSSILVATVEEDQDNFLTANKENEKATTQRKRKLSKEQTSDVARKKIQQIADTEILNKNELHLLQMENEKKKGRNLDLEEELLRQKNLYVKNKNAQIAEKNSS